MKYDVTNTKCNETIETLDEDTKHYLCSQKKLKMKYSTNEETIIICTTIRS